MIHRAVILYRYPGRITRDLTRKKPQATMASADSATVFRGYTLPEGNVDTLPQGATRALDMRIPRGPRGK